MLVGKFTLLFSVIAAAPLCVLPSKDTIEELFYKEKGMNMRQNVVATIGICIAACLIAISLDNIGDAMALVGSTINPIIGFIMPVIFYWKVMNEK